MPEISSPDALQSPALGTGSVVPDVVPPAELPQPLMPLVGRAHEVATTRDALLSPNIRLITLTGPGGVGKSRVAIQTASDVEKDFPDGVRLIRLATLDDPNLLLPTIARAVGLPDPGTDRPVDALRAGLLGRRMVLLLDSFEPVTEAGPLLADLLRACPELKALATSRVRLRLRGEHVIRIPPLPTPSAADASDPAALLANPAVQLFTQQAIAVNPDFHVDPDNAPTVAEIVSRLDGLPLAIELAAARLSLFSPATLLTRLERRLPLLRGGASDLPDRLRTMRGAIAWSYDLLDADEQRLLRCLAVFAGGFPLGAVPAVFGEGDEFDALDGISSLLDKSLLYAAPVDPGEQRYAMLETIREFGLEQLESSGEADSVHRLHAEWCLDLAERAAASRIAEGISADWLDRIDLDHDDMRSALAWCEALGDTAAFIRLTGALGWFWLLRSHRSEGRGWLRRAIARAEQAGDRNLALARSLDSAAVLAFTQGDYEEAGTRAKENLALSQELGDLWGTAAAHNLLGVVARAEGAFDQAADSFTQALILFQRQAMFDWAALTLLNLGTVAYWQGVSDRAHQLMTEALALFRQQGNRYGMAVALSDLGLVAVQKSDQARAASLFQESLESWRGVGTEEVLVDWLARVATLAVASQRHEQAVQLFGAVERACETIGYCFERPEQERQTQARDAARANLGATLFEVAWQQGQRQTREDAVAGASEFLATVSEPPPVTEVREGSVPFGLTSRELEVLRLLGEGRTDKEIGAALFISHRTAMNHVARILAKLEVPSRAVAAREAARHGLL
jgi:predicted ATPase/DNA-binding CsgD family transcriptional regulator